MSDTAQKKVARATGRRYESVSDLLRATSTSDQVQKEFSSLMQSTRVTSCLARVRQKAGISQAKMADLLGCSQSRISKLESSRDEEVTLGEIRDYARHTGTAIEARVGPPVTHVEAVKLHAFEIRRHLQALAALAHKDDELNSAIQGFFGEAFFNLLGIMTECQKEMPQSEEASEIGVQIIAPSRKMEEASSLGSG